MLNWSALTRRRPARHGAGRHGTALPDTALPDTAPSGAALRTVALPTIASRALPRQRITRWRSAHCRVSVVIVLAIASLAGCVSLDAQERKWIFQASAIQQEAEARATGSAAAAWDTGDAVMQGFWITYPPKAGGTDVRLQAIWCPSDDPKAPALLYLHGARWGIEDSNFRILQMRELGFSVLAVEYRGFGRSTVALPSEATVVEDARAGWAWLERQHPELDRYIFGHSLGGAVAVDLASEVPDAKGLIVEGTFTSIADVVRSFRWGWLPLAPLITQRFDSIDKIGRVRSPVLVVHGADDKLIPPALGRALYDKATGPKRFVLVDGGTHYSTNRVGQAQYREALHQLFGLNTADAEAADDPQDSGAEGGPTGGAAAGSAAGAAPAAPRPRPTAG